jgi:hypothetical protein
MAQPFTVVVHLNQLESTLTAADGLEALTAFHQAATDFGYTVDRTESDTETVYTFTGSGANLVRVLFRSARNIL